MSFSSSDSGDTIVYDVLIVGAGPVGLAVAARIRENAPAAIFTDEEHRRYQWLRKYGKRVSIKKSKTGKETRFTRNIASSSDDSDHTDADSLDERLASGGIRRRQRMLVVDESDSSWLGRWDRLFGAYRITHLRSPLIWHVDPQDRDSLLARAHEQNNPDDLFDVGACVGKEISKHLKKKRCGRRGGLQDSQPNVDINERERNDYFTPSRKLFYDHCSCVRDRYGLDGETVRQEMLKNVEYGFVRDVSENDEENLFTVTTDKGRHYARIVVLAVGPANVASIPWISGMPPELRGEDNKVLLAGNLAAQAAIPQASHTFHITQVPDPLILSRIRARRETNVLVVGGGLTSAQIADAALRSGVTRVWHLMRGNVVVKYFDVDLSWMGKYRNREQARFWSADSDHERMDIVREARGGGSITPHFHRILKKHVASGKVRLHTRTVVSDVEFQPGGGSGSDDGGVWKITTDPPLEIPPIDFMYFATGIETDVATLPYMQSILNKYPIDTVGGYPCLTEDLMWTDNVPLFCAGKLAMLRIGPASPNIGGAKLAAERIGLAVDQVLRSTRTDGGVDDSDEEPDLGTDYVSGVGSKYKCLDLDAQ